MEKIKILPKKQHSGFDIVNSLIERNTKKHEKNNIKFYYINSLKDFKN